jgi:two-component system, chemotaxis family, chemotaxis protein CheY
MDNLQDKADQLMEILDKTSTLLFSKDIDDDIIEDILMDWGEAAVRLENKTLEIEADPSKTDALDAIKRTLHTLKGDCGVFGLHKASDIFHQVETLLEQYLEEKASPSPMLLKIVDWLNKTLNKIGAGDIQIDDKEGGEAVNESEPVKDAQKVQNEPKLKILVVDDDFTNRLLLLELLKFYGAVHVAVNGKEAVEAVVTAIKDKTPYDFACLDIMMPEMDGQQALKYIREEEAKAGIMPGRGIKIIMTTALDDSKNIIASFKEQCDGYIVKPISRVKLIEQLEKLSLI